MAIKQVTASAFWIGMIFLASLCYPSSVSGQSDDEGQLRNAIKNSRAQDELPAELVIRFWAHVTDVDSDSDDSELKETWEFSRNRIHKLVLAQSGKKYFYRREKSAPFDTRGLLRLLDKGKFLKIEGQEGMGPPSMFAGTKYDIGDRGIELLVGGDPVLEVGEACVFGGYRETNSRALTVLYEKLASKARAEFKDSKKEKSGS